MNEVVLGGFKPLTLISISISILDVPKTNHGNSYDFDTLRRPSIPNITPRLPQTSPPAADAKIRYLSNNFAGGQYHDEGA